MTTALPTGTLTFLFTDIEGSTTRWEQQREAMSATLVRHDEILRAAIEGHDGGWDLEPAESVGPGENIEVWEVLDLLGALVEKSLVVVGEGCGSTRYGLLETVRQYAGDRLSEAGETAEARDRHLGHYVALAEAMEPHLGGREQVAWFERCDVEQANLVAAVEWAIERGDAESGFGIGSALQTFILNHGRVQLRWQALMDRLNLDASLPPELHVRALRLAGNIEVGQGDLVQARAYLEEALGRADSLSDPSLRDDVVRGMVLLESKCGNEAAAVELGRQNLEFARKANDPRRLTTALFNSAFNATRSGDYEKSKRLLNEALPLARRSASPVLLGFVLRNLGYLAIEQSDGESAIPYLEEDAAIRRLLRSDSELCESLPRSGESERAAPARVASSRRRRDRLLLGRALVGRQHSPGPLTRGLHSARQVCRSLVVAASRVQHRQLEQRTV